MGERKSKSGLKIGTQSGRPVPGLPTPGSGRPLKIDLWFLDQHRALRARFRMETLEHHADRLLRALYARREALRTEAT